MYEKIRTHEFPDLDAILCILLLWLFGESKFPGISRAKLDFVSAADGFDQANPSNSNVIAVDIEGGQFDHHDGEKSSKCSAILVAEYLGVNKDPSLTKILDTVNLSDTTGKISGIRIEANVLLFTLFEILRGWYVLHGGDHALTVTKTIDCLKAMIASEKEWLQAMIDAEKAIKIEGVVLKVLAISSDSKAAMKAGRMAGGNVVIVANPNGNVGINGTTNQAWREPNLTVTAAILRLVTAEAAGIAPDYEQLFDCGTNCGWFL
ncbi:MAG: hypothetical protein NTW50_01060, partial [Candidatus Berkelbacteria bacterium]|nr:hypothetical protein [Candidatus Berkelbacteria bacterium]